MAEFSGSRRPLDDRLGVAPFDILLRGPFLLGPDVEASDAICAVWSTGPEGGAITPLGLLGEGAGEGGSSELEGVGSSPAGFKA